MSSGSASDPLALADAVTLSEDLQEMLEPGSVRKASLAEEKEEKAAPGAEDDDDEDEAPAAEVVSEAPSSEVAASEADASASWSEADVALMRVVDLRDALESMGLDTTGKKAALAERLIEALKATPAAVQEESEAAEPAAEAAEPAAEAAEPAAEAAEPAAEAAPVEDALATAAPAWSEEEIGEMKIAELREALGFLELDTTGKKAVLAERLLAALYPKSAPAEAAEEEEVPAVEEPEPPKARGRGNKRASIDEAEPPAAVARPKRAKTAETAPVAAVEEEAPKRRPKRELAAEPAAAPQRASRSRR